ncbi:hypothetical protein N7463_008816 [Penicillium fimorum]|uniref:Uncharacterized protein n=1 Tax=Penicillium fimorum TaxID=1882269 RepID=A0A9W9XPK5_9EURO|nr:hypothetical protein N7463_008816 [Penicillium fimorum]
MSSPIKLEGTLSEMKQGDARLLVYASLCHEGKIDMDKLAGLLGMKTTSAATNYYRAKGRLQAMVGEGSPTKTVAFNSEAATKSDDASKSEATDAGAPAKKSRTRKRAVAKDTSNKSDGPSKRRNAVTKAASEPTEESAQIEKISDTAELAE